MATHAAWAATVAAAAVAAGQNTGPLNRGLNVAPGTYRIPVTLCNGAGTMVEQSYLVVQDK